MKPPNLVRNPSTEERAFSAVSMRFLQKKTCPSFNCFQGTLHYLSLFFLVEQYNIKNFVESGTGSGDSMKVIVESGLFDNFHGIELDEEMYDDLVDRFPDVVNFYNGYYAEKIY